MKYLVILILITGKVKSQDSTILKKDFFSVSAVALPNFIGYNVSGMIEYNLNTSNSISIGFKNSYWSDAAGYSVQKNNCIISEFKHYFKKDKKSIHFIAPYIKFRNHNYYTYEGGQTYSNYYEKSFGIGAIYGEKFIFDKKERFFMTVFVGGGYFIGFEKSYFHKTRGGPLSLSPHNNLGIMGNKIDIRIGTLFGFQFKK